MDSAAMFFSAALARGSATALRGVKREHLAEDWRPVLDYIVDFTRQNGGALPRPATVEGHFGRPLPDAPEDPAFYARAIRDNAMRVAMEEGLVTKVAEPLKAGSPADALRGVKEVAAQVARDFREDGRGLVLRDMTDNVPVRRHAYQLRKRLTDRIGLPTPFPTLTRATGGYKAGEGWVVLARPNVGKSWWLILSAVHLWQLGLRVLFASMETPPEGALPRDPRHRVVGGRCIRCGQEMPPEAAALLCEVAQTPEQRLSVRFDAIGARVSGWRLLKGLLVPQEERKLEAYYEALPSRAGGRWGDLRIVAAPAISSVSDLETEILEYRPDIVFWDSAYLAAGHDESQRSGAREHGKAGAKGGGGGEWGKQRNPAGALIVDTKLMFERLGLPGVLSWHFNRDVDEKATTASMNDAALTDEVGRVFDVLVGLFRPPEIEAAGEAILRSLKVRDGIAMRELRVHFKAKDEINFAEIGEGSPGRRSDAVESVPGAKPVGGKK